MCSLSLGTGFVVYALSNSIVHLKTITMAKDSNTSTGKPSGVNKPMQGTGVPTVINDENKANDQRLTEGYTDDDNEVNEGTRIGHPNRNTDKGDATNIDGYRN
jgi:hypothetical protein